MAYCTADCYDIQRLTFELSDSLDFHVTSDKNSNMMHILDQSHGGEIYLFNNGTFVCWGLTELQQTKFLSHYVAFTNNVEKCKESVEYIIDEDE